MQAGCRVGRIGRMEEFASRKKEERPLLLRASRELHCQIFSQGVMRPHELDPFQG